MTPEEVPDELLLAATIEWQDHLQRTLNRSNLTALREVLAAVLPAHERMVRDRLYAQIHAEYMRVADGEGDLDDDYRTGACRGLNRAMGIVRGKSS